MMIDEMPVIATDVLLSQLGCDVELTLRKALMLVEKQLRETERLEQYLNEQLTLLVTIRNQEDLTELGIIDDSKDLTS